MDSLAFRAGNILVGNPPTTEGLEIVILPGVGFALEFFVPTVIAITGREVSVTVDNKVVDTWSRIIVPSGGKLRLAVDPKNSASSTGFRVYFCVRGGFPSIPTYLGSKSTSMGLGGYQVRIFKIPGAISSAYVRWPILRAGLSSKAINWLWESAVPRLGKPHSLSLARGYRNIHRNGLSMSYLVLTTPKSSSPQKASRNFMLRNFVSALLAIGWVSDLKRQKTLNGPERVEGKVVLIRAIFLIMPMRTRLLISTATRL
jgi:hypothetical protein